MIQNPRAQRSNVLLAASIEAFGRVFSVKLRNLSIEGALVEGEDLPVEGSKVVFKRSALTVDSHVAWVLDGQAGLAFTRPIAREDVLRNIPSPRSREPLKYARPGFARRELTPEEQQLARTWGVAPAPSRPGK